MYVFMACAPRLTRTAFAPSQVRVRPRGFALLGRPRVAPAVNAAADVLRFGGTARVTSGYLSAGLSRR